MLFIETTLFTKELGHYLTDDEYASLQAFLADKPDAGVLVQGTGGLRKLRWSSHHKGKGKRGGVRIIYYWQVTEEQIYLMTIYTKNEMTDLSAKDKKLIKQMLERW